MLGKLTIQEINIVNLLSGLFLIANIPFFLNDLQPQYVTYPYRVISALLSIVVIIQSKNKPHLYIYILGSFFILYLLRMVYDFYVLDIKYTKPAHNYLATFLFASVIPVISIFNTNFNQVNLQRVFCAVGLVYLLYAFPNLLAVPFFDFANRSSGITPLWPISFGQGGTTLCLLALCAVKLKPHKYIYILSFFSFLIGLYIVILSGSKGPLLTLLILSLVIILYRTAHLNKSIVAIISLTSFFLYLLYRNPSSIAMVERFINIVHDPSTTERLEILRITVVNIQQHLWFGSSFLLKHNNIPITYPHHLFLEAFMTTGLLGGFLFICISAVAFRESFFLLEKEQYFWMVILFWQYFLQAFYSSSLYSSTFFWIMLAIMINLKCSITYNNLCTKNI